MGRCDGIWCRNIKQYIEPAYYYGFGHSHDKAIGVSLGLLISVR